MAYARFDYSDAARTDGADRPEPFTVARHALVQAPTGIAELLAMRQLTRQFTDAAYTPQLQLVFATEGYHYVSDIGGPDDEVLVDFNQITVIPAGLTTRDRHPSRGDTSCLIITPEPELLDELWRHSANDRFRVSDDRCASRPITTRGQYMAAFVANRQAPSGELRDAALEEIVVALVREASGGWTSDPGRFGPRSLALARSVKELLVSSEETLSLSQIGRAVGASPAYLTDLFRRTEGMPIYRYQKRLRLARALNRLPATDDIIDLALELGFSSHSHFSSAFRQTYGLSPSAHREAVRRRVVRLAPLGERPALRAAAA